MLKNKKGNFPDIITTFEFAMVFSFAGLILLIFMGQFNTNIQGMNESIVPNATKLALSEYNSAIPGFIDIVFVAIILVFYVFSIMAARLIPSSPKFYLVTFFAMILFTMGGMMIENFWTGWAENSLLAVQIAKLTFVPFIMNHMLFLALIYSASIGIALLSKEG